MPKNFAVPANSSGRATGKIRPRARRSGSLISPRSIGVSVGPGRSRRRGCPRRRDRRPAPRQASSPAPPAARQTPIDHPEDRAKNATRVTITAGLRAICASSLVQRRVKTLPPGLMQRKPFDRGPVADALIAETVQVPASEVLHVYRPIDAGQIRGLPHVAPAMVRLFLLDQYRRRQARPEEDRGDVRGLHHQDSTRGGADRRGGGRLGRQRHRQPRARHPAGAAAGRGGEVLGAGRRRLRGLPVAHPARGLRLARATGPPRHRRHHPRQLLEPARRARRVPSAGRAAATRG